MGPPPPEVSVLGGSLAGSPGPEGFEDPAVVAKIPVEEVCEDPAPDPIPPAPVPADPVATSGVVAHTFGADIDGAQEAAEYVLGTDLLEEESFDDELEARPLSEILRESPARVATMGGILVVALILLFVFVLGRPETPPFNAQALGRQFAPRSVPASQPPVGYQDQTVPSLQLPALAALTAGGPDPGSLTGSFGDPSLDPPSGQSAALTAPSAPAPAPSSSPPPAASPSTTVAPGQCALNDLAITTTTDSVYYGAGESVVVTSKLVDLIPCVFSPQPSGPYSCPTTVTVVDATGAQVYPMTGQSEQCGPVEGGTLATGATRSVTIVWNQQFSVDGIVVQAPDGVYRAVGTWNWATGGPLPGSYNAQSAPFALIP
jgi:hypothetical protein